MIIWLYEESGTIDCCNTFFGIIRALRPFAYLKSPPGARSGGKVQLGNKLGAIGGAAFTLVLKTKAV